MHNVIGLILAGGKSRRMGQDKSWVELESRPMIAHVIERVLPQVSTLTINTNSTDIAYAQLGYDVVSDAVEGYVGPLAGILTGMIGTKDTDILFTTAVDCPLLPTDLVATLLRYMTDGVDIVRVRSGGRHHPVIALWRTTMREDLHNCIVNKDIRKVDDFTKKYTIVDVDFDNTENDVFFNINKEQDIKTYNKIK